MRISLFKYCAKTLHSQIFKSFCRESLFIDLFIINTIEHLQYGVWCERKKRMFLLFKPREPGAKRQLSRTRKSAYSQGLSQAAPTRPGWRYITVCSLSVCGRPWQLWMDNLCFWLSLEPMPNCRRWCYCRNKPEGTDVWLFLCAICLFCRGLE